MEGLILVQLSSSGVVQFYHPGSLVLKTGDYVIVEHDRGMDCGCVIPVSGAHCPAEDIPKEQVKKVIRLAKESDLKQVQDNAVRAKEAFSACEKKIAEHKLEMKLVKAEYSFDRSKILFYFTSDGRVDFRELVKDLAKVFKARIELRQIGVRDEARLFGGYGSCGRELCCRRFLKDFEPVTIKMAKEEGLPLNPPKISGLCGRLMCCLSYEYETYKILSRGLPREGEHINTPQGRGKVTSVNVFCRKVGVQLDEGAYIEMDYKPSSGAEEKKPETANRNNQGKNNVK
ncbi:MAG: stage 0 sporulation family protein [Candidatus Omnitrophica bacterium]|jgi:cell fate regulator YaaT (PSP1 superfamily)|nr:stage 0 sporulation family protein [Candidatus Omnitrophota bacterium]